MADGPTILIATPLEPELVERIRTQVPTATVLFDPGLLPTPRYPCDHRGAAGFRRDAAGERRWREWLAVAEVLYGAPGDSPRGLAEAVRAGPRLHWVQGTAAGSGELLRHAGLSAEEAAGFTLTTAAGVHARQLAEWAMLGLLALTKDLPRLLADQRARRWDHYPVRELAGSHLLVVGLGEIGRTTARYARALGMRVTGVRRDVPAGAANPADPDVDELRPVHELPALVEAADAVVLALPATPHTEKLLSAALIDALPRHAIIVNVGRGSTLDEDALVAALRSGRVAGAALDVTATEPLPPDSALWELPNVLLSPHTAALSTKENARIVELFIDNLRRYLDGRPLRNVVDPTLLY